jgi:tetratricopeptide (TPR) repeat protein
LLFALGLMSKPMLVALPFVLLLLDYWPLGRLARGAGLDQGVSVQHCKAPALQLVLEKLPFFVLSGVGCVLTILAQQKGHAVVSTGGLPIPERIGHALVSYVHYLAVCFWPRHLSVFYPYENSGATEMAACALLLVAVTVAAVWVGRRLPYLLVGWFWFIGMLVPVIGLVQVGEQAWADRYMYLPSIGFLISAAWGVSDIAARKKPRAPNLGVQASSSLQISNLGAGTLAVLGGLVSLVAMAGTVVQLAYWRNTRTLFEHAEKVTRNNYMAIALVGSLQAAEGNPEDAIERYRRALEIRPGYAEAHYLLGDALEKQGRTEEAIAEYRQALRFKPIQFQAHISLGLALAKQHNDAEAAEHYRAALRINPDSAVAHNNLARLMHSQGKLDEAIEHYRAAIEYGPSLAEARNNLGAVLVQQGELPEGIAQLREALRINGGNSQTELNLALALCQQGDWSQAAELFARAAGKVPWDANLHYRFGVALEHNRKPKEAMGEYASALLMQPDFPDALAALAWVLATASDSSLRNGTEAVSMAERACDLTSRKDPDKLQVLAAAYAETGQFHEALSALTNARLEAVAGKNTDLIQKSERMDAAFRSGQPWRDLP